MTARFEYLMIFLMFGATGLFFSGCEKEEGEGGRSSISGILIEQEMTNALNNEVVREYPLVDERVYIIYGDSTEVYDDDMRTDFEGRFKFRFLRKGTYTIFAYTECNQIYDEGCQDAGGTWAVKRTIELGKNEDVVLENIVVQNFPQ